MIIRNFREKDIGEIFALYNKCMIADRVDYDFFMQYLLLSPNFSPEGLFVAEDGSRITGWTLGETVFREFDPWGDHVKKNSGRGFLMAPATEDHTTGMKLIAAAENYLAAQNCKQIRCAIPGYTLFPNGIDEKNYPQLHQLLLDAGYEISEYSYSMERSLENYSTPEKIRLTAEKLAAQGIIADTCRINDLPGLRHLLAESDLKNWMHLVLRKAEQKKLDEAVVLRNQEKLLGYCQYNYFGTPERIGPFGIAPEIRGKGAGTVMIAKLLEIMSEKNFKHVWFASCSEGLIDFYAGNGLQVFRKKSIFEKKIQ
ncbi:MAG: GNAT family N-acetyltransferase [Lentisphaeria bacterium]|nr:GNAT family N-acetyltransferase [Lentisphaeria bacterium]